MKKVLLGICVTILLASCNDQPVRVACIGDSITAGYGLEAQSQTSYPAVLGDLLGNDFIVFNFGRSAATLSKQGDFPYWITKEFSNVFCANPDIIIIQLGTNDTKPKNWNSENYEQSYQALIDTLNTITSNPLIYVCKPVPVYKDIWAINDSILNAGVIPVIEKIAVRNNLVLLDLNEAMNGSSDLFPDGVHPNEEGMKKIAAYLAMQIKK